MIRVCLTVLAVIFASQSTQAQTLSGPRIDDTFRAEGFYPVSTGSDEPHYLAMFYYKLMNYNGQAALCGAYTSTIFDDRDHKLFLRASRASLKGTVEFRDFRYMQRLADFPQSARYAKASFRHMVYPLSMKHGLGLPAICKVSKRAWDPSLSTDDVKLNLATSRVKQRVRR